MTFKFLWKEVTFADFLVHLLPVNETRDYFMNVWWRTAPKLLFKSILFFSEMNYYHFHIRTQKRPESYATENEKGVDLKSVFDSM